MDQFAELRKQAIEKRNKAIYAARQEYRLAVQQIDELAHTLGVRYQGRIRTKTKPVLKLIRELLPQDRLFTISDILDELRAHDPRRHFNPHSVRTFFPRLVELGEVRRVARNGCGHVLWAVPGLHVEDTEFGAMSLPEAAEKVLRETGPLKLLELVIELRRRGFRPHREPSKLMHSLKVAARTYPGRFSVGDDGRWAVDQMSTPHFVD